MLNVSCFGSACLLHGRCPNSMSTWAEARISGILPYARVMKCTRLLGGNECPELIILRRAGLKDITVETILCRCSQHNQTPEHKIRSDPRSPRRLLLEYYREVPSFFRNPHHPKLRCREIPGRTSTRRKMKRGNR